MSIHASTERAARPRCRCGDLEHDPADQAGFSLLEVLVATAVVTIGVVALAQLFTISSRANRSARSTTFASMLAQEKMEQLRGLTWAYDAAGLPLSDTSTDLTGPAERPTGGTGLTPSPGGSLGSNTSGYCDYLDATGRSLGGGSAPPAGTVYIRRWSIEPLPVNPGNTLVLQVLVTRFRDGAAASTAASTTRFPDQARLVSVRTRKASS